MKDIYEKVELAIKKHKLIKDGEKVLVGVSGGPDSIALLHILYKLGKKMNFSIAAATFDHRMRPESKRETIFVKETVEELGIPFFSGRANNKQKLLGCSEQTARKMRFDFLLSTAKSNNFDRIALAHNLDDLVETFLMHLIRGAGITGLAAIRPSSFDGKIVHPLIYVERKEIEHYLNKGHLKYVTDMTNYDMNYTRNYIRYRLIPVLTSINPEFKKSIFSLASIFEEEDRFIDLIVKTDLKAMKINEETYSLSLFDSLPLFERRRIMRIILGDEVKFERIERVLDEMSLRKRKINISADQYLVASRGEFWIERKTPYSLHKTYLLKVPGTTEIPESSCVLKASYGKTTEQQLSRNLIVIDAESAKFPLAVRFRKPGDVMSTESGSKKVQDIMVDSRIRADRRYKVPIVVDSEDRIIWIVGVRRSVLYMINKETRKVLTIEASFNK